MTLDSHFPLALWPELLLMYSADSGSTFSFFHNSNKRKLMIAQMCFFSTVSYSEYMKWNHFCSSVERSSKIISSSSSSLPSSLFWLPHLFSKHWCRASRCNLSTRPVSVGVRVHKEGSAVRRGSNVEPQMGTRSTGNWAFLEKLNSTLLSRQPFKEGSKQNT